MYKSQERQGPSIISECDTMFNERDRRCAAVQLMPSSDSSYDNRAIASTLKMQIRTVQRLRAQLNASDDPLDGYGYGFDVVSSEDHIMPLHIFEVGLKVHTKVYLDVLKSVVIIWCIQVAGVAAGLGTGALELIGQRVRVRDTMLRF